MVLFLFYLLAYLLVRRNLVLSLLKYKVKGNKMGMILVFPVHSDKMMRKKQLNFICAYAMTSFLKYFDLAVAAGASSPNWSGLAIVFTG